MSIKTSQAILKCFIDLKSSVWFTLGSEDETVFCDTWNFFQPGQGFRVTILHGRRGRLSFRCSIKKSAVVWENEERLPVK